MSKFLITIVGPTSIGKTSLSIKLAKYYNTEIISADSRQFYRELNIGTAKPSKEELSSVKHHLINNISVTDKYDISRFESDARNIINKLFKTKDYLILVGGSGLYIDTILYGIDKMPEVDQSLRKKLNREFLNNGLRNLLVELKKIDPITYKNIDLNNHRRIIRALEVSISSKKPYSSYLHKFSKYSKYSKYNEIIIGLNCDRNKLHSLINKRVDKMIQYGLVQEAEKLKKFKNLNALNSIGYKEIFEFLEYKISLEEAINKIKTNTRRYAKRQITWFNSNKTVNWFNDEYEISNLIKLINSQSIVQQST
tara:strand:+ start:504 stop:1433 length:930 start_codon:yes stop_codon:yes gene_type:complete